MAFRKRILLALLFCFCFNFSKAQFVTIPDTNFVNWLNNNGYSSCMNGNQLNASCPAVQNTIGLNLLNEVIPDITGINAFTNLTFLNVTRCGCGNVGSLPSSLIELGLYDNDFFVLNSLPPNLEILDCGSNHLNSLPPLPATLNTLLCDNNLLITLPALPDSLKFLDCRHNNLSSLPTLPGNLSQLICNDNYSLTTLPYIPNSVKNINCNFCGLTSLTNLPDSISDLIIINNPGLKCLPSTNRIFNLNWGNTGLTCLPDGITIVNSTPSIQNLPLCNWNNVNNCEIGKTIEGSIFQDSNSNCILDTLEVKHPIIKVNLSSNGSLIQQTYTNQLGNYSFGTGAGSFVIAPDTASSNYTVDCPLFQSYSVLIDSLNPLEDSLDFSLSCKPSFDLEALTIYSDSGILRPANIARIRTIAGEKYFGSGINCASGISGFVKVVLQGPNTYLNPSPNALIPSISGDTLIYYVQDFGILNPSIAFGFNIQVDSAATQNALVCISVFIDSIVGDINLSNNFHFQCLTVVNSFDPNDKMVFPFGSIDTSQYWLTYTIRFQNTGNAPAQHINIIDTLDQEIIKSSFQLLAFSHEPQTQIIGKRVQFNFPNINLPDSVNNEPASHGFVQYRVKRKNNLPIGTQIHNTAFIYFDFNAPVQTNTTVNEIGVTSGVGVGENQNPILFSIYPNPIASGQMLNIYFNSSEKKKAELRLYDLSGRKLFSQFVNPSEQSQQVNLPSLSPGIYLVIVNDGKHTAQQKLVVMH